MGMMPERLTRPTVGLMPARPLEEDGQTIDPPVSVPMPTAARFAEIHDPVPELDPQGLRSRAYGFLVRPPRPLHPLVEWLERMFAHSLRFVFPRMTAPAARSFCATNESLGGFEPTSASDPAVVIMRSAVSMLSLIRTGMPCSGPRCPFALRSRSRASAIASASGLSSMMAFTEGPRLSMSSMRAVYFSTNEWAVCLPEFIPSCSSVTVVSSSSNGLTSDTGFAGDVSRAPPRAGYSTAAVLVVTAFCRNLRREGRDVGMEVLRDEFGCAGYLITNRGQGSRRVVKASQVESAVWKHPAASRWRRGVRRLAMTTCRRSLVVSAFQR